MPQPTAQEHMADSEDVLDSITKKVMQVLIENPRIPYNKTSLAEAADVSRDALYRRWDTYQALDLVEEAETGGKRRYWRLNPDAELVDVISRLLYPS